MPAEGAAPAPPVRSDARGPAWLWPVAALGASAFPALHLWDVPMSTFYGALALLGGCYALHHTRLSVRVVPAGVEWRFRLTPGWHRVPADDIAGAEVVGLGARPGVGTRLTRVGPLHNVGAPVAVRLLRRRHEDLLLGTDRPDAIVRALDARRSPTTAA